MLKVFVIEPPTIYCGYHSSTMVVSWFLQDLLQFPQCYTCCHLHSYPRFFHGLCLCKGQVGEVHLATSILISLVTNGSSRCPPIHSKQKALIANLNDCGLALAFWSGFLRLVSGDFCFSSIFLSFKFNNLFQYLKQ